MKPRGTFQLMNVPQMFVVDQSIQMTCKGPVNANVWRSQRLRLAGRCLPTLGGAPHSLSFCCCFKWQPGLSTQYKVNCPAAKY